MPEQTELDLVAAVIKGDAKKVKTLLDSGVSPNSIGWSVNAVQKAKEHSDIKKWLKEESPTSVGQGTHALTAAVQAQKIEMCRLLLDHGADINIRHHGDIGDSQTPLMFASADGSLDIVELLVERGCEVVLFDKNGRTAVTHAVRHGRNNVTDFLRFHINKIEIEMSLPDAVTNLQEKRVLALLEKGANPNEVDRFGLTPLNRACAANEESIVDILLKAGADPTLGSDFNKATEKGVVEQVEQYGQYLLEPNGRATICRMVELGGLRGSAPIYSACMNGNLSVVKKLLNSGCDINIASTPGCVTPLMMAVKAEQVELIEFLLDSGASVTARDAGKATALDWALEVKRVSLGSSKALEIIELFNKKLGRKTEKVDYKQVWKRFRENESTQEFQKTIDFLSKECETKPYPWKKRKGVQRFYVKNVDSLAKKFGKGDNYIKSAPKDAKEDRKQEIASILQNKVRELGFLLISHKDEQGSAMQLLFPTLDKFEVIAACGTDGYNYGYTTDDIIERLKAIDQKFPFVLTDCMHDAVGGRLENSLEDGKELASELYEFCTDLIDGELVSSTDDVAKQIEQSQSFYLWWD